MRDIEASFRSFFFFLVFGLVRLKGFFRCRRDDVNAQLLNAQALKIDPQKPFNSLTQFKQQLRGFPSWLRAALLAKGCVVSLFL